MTQPPSGPALLGPLGDARVVLAVSPHLDDAALSVGGTLAQLTEHGAEVIVYSVFAGAPSGDLSDFARAMHARYGLAQGASAFAERYREDRAGLGALGARAEHGPFLESIYRMHRDGSWRIDHSDDIFRSEPEDIDLVPPAEAEIVRLARTLDVNLLLGPAAIGGNIDHVLTAEACRRAADRLGIATMRWEDQPYGWNLPPSDFPFTSSPLPASAVASKVRALTHYQTQTRMLWPGADWRPIVQGHPVERFILPPKAGLG